MPSIELRNISNYVCQNVNLKIFDKELLVLLGPNGAGKTTLLNIIAGLIDYQGSVLFDGKSVDKLPASKRKIGYLFQELALFPHLDVASNIAYGLKVQKRSQDEIEARVEKLLQMMKIKHLSSRYPRHLSGGEKQRVALARALALSPEVLLLDEPLSSLDVQTSKYLRVELKQLLEELGVTTIYVTHDLVEAEEVADRIAIIQSGGIQQAAAPQEVFFHPKNELVSDFIGAPNILNCDYCHSLGQGIMEVDCDGLKILVPHDGDMVQRIALLPGDVYISNTNPPGPQMNRFKGTVSAIKPASNATRIEVKVGKKTLLAEMSHRLFEDMDLVLGKEVFLLFKMRRIRVYENKNNGVK